MKSKANISEFDVVKINDKLIGEKIENDEDENLKKIIFLFMFILLIISLNTYFKKKKNNKVKIKDSDGNTREVDTIVTEKEIDKVLEKLQN